MPGPPVPPGPHSPASARPLQASPAGPAKPEVRLVQGGQQAAANGNLATQVSSARLATQPQHGSQQQQLVSSAQSSQHHTTNLVVNTQSNALLVGGQNGVVGQHAPPPVPLHSSAQPKLSASPGQTGRAALTPAQPTLPMARSTPPAPGPPQARHSAPAPAPGPSQARHPAPATAPALALSESELMRSLENSAMASVAAARAAEQGTTTARPSMLLSAPALAPLTIAAPAPAQTHNIPPTPLSADLEEAESQLSQLLDSLQGGEGGPAPLLSPTTGLLSSPEPRAGVIQAVPRPVRQPDPPPASLGPPNVTMPGAGGGPSSQLRALHNLPANTRLQSGANGQLMVQKIQSIELSKQRQQVG